MSPYKHVFFDLDRTLWDMDGNSIQTLTELAGHHKIIERGISSVPEFIKRYKVINDQLWEAYSKDLVDKETLRVERFRKTFRIFGIDDERLAVSFGNDYIEKGPLKNTLIPDTLEVLDYLHKKYQLHIITNGFEEVQHIKIANSNIKKYFNKVITSEMAGYKKPDARIFNYSMALAEANVENSIMIGDSLEADIKGARATGMAQVYFNIDRTTHNEKVTHEISSLKMLMDFL
jgi:putative hydrolase of the HAD superfamily